MRVRRDEGHEFVQFVTRVNYNHICRDLRQDGKILHKNGIMLLLSIYL